VLGQKGLYPVQSGRREVEVEKEKECRGGPVRKGSGKGGRKYHLNEQNNRLDREGVKRDERMEGRDDQNEFGEEGILDLRVGGKEGVERRMVRSRRERPPSWRLESRIHAGRFIKKS